MLEILLLGLVAAFAGAVSASAQESASVWERVKAVNMPAKSLKANWHRVYRSPMLVEDLESEGTVELRQPDYLRWETTSPVSRVTEMDANAPRGRFKLPKESDFKVTVLENEDYTIQLDPIRRDLKQLVGQIALTVDKKSCLLKYVVIIGPEGDWSRIDFFNVVKE